MSLEINVTFFFSSGLKKESLHHRNQTAYYTHTQSSHMSDTETSEECASLPHKLCGFEIQLSSPLNSGEHVPYVPNKMAELLMEGIMEEESHIIL